MSRVAKIKMADWDPALREMAGGEGVPPVVQTVLGVLAHRPAFAKAKIALLGAFKSEQTLSDRLIELLRLRQAFHNQCRTCMSIRYQDAIDDGLTEEVVCSLQKPAEAPGLTDQERAALAFCDRFCTDHLSIDDSHFDALRKHFDEGQVVELTLYLSLLGFGRMAAVYDMVEDLPDHFDNVDLDRLTPWSSPHIVLGGAPAEEASETIDTVA